MTVLTTDAMAPHERLEPGETVEDGVRIVRVASVTGALRSWLNLSTPIGFGRRAARLLAMPAATRPREARRSRWASSCWSRAPSTCERWSAAASEVSA